MKAFALVTAMCAAQVLGMAGGSPQVIAWGFTFALMSAAALLGSVLLFKARKTSEND
ncbi:hypothetical protein [Desulfobacula sp.]